MPLIRRLMLITLMVLLPFQAQATPNPFDLPPELHEALNQTFTALFNDEIDKAKEILSTLKNPAASHPLVSLAHVAISWWRMSETVLETDEDMSTEFMKQAQECITQSKQRMATGNGKAEGQFALATTLGLMSRWSVANRAWIAAYVRGTKATEYSKQTLKINPKARDAYMTLGTFNYARDIIKRSVEKEGTDTDKEPAVDDGLLQLRKAYNEGSYFQLAAGLLLAGILTNEKPTEALPLLIDLKKKLPKSGFVQMIHITALYNAGQLEEMKIETKSYLEKIEAGEFSSFYKPHAHFAQGLTFFKENNWKDAADSFEKATREGTEQNPYTTWAHLYKGYALDALGKRSKAKDQYNLVLKLKRRFASHDHARERLQKPFSPIDIELKKLEL